MVKCAVIYLLKYVLLIRELKVRKLEKIHNNVLERPDFIVSSREDALDVSQKLAEFAVNRYDIIVNDANMQVEALLTNAAAEAQDLVAGAEKAAAEMIEQANGEIDNLFLDAEEKLREADAEIAELQEKASKEALRVTQLRAFEVALHNQMLDYIDQMRDLVAGAVEPLEGEDNLLDAGEEVLPEELQPLVDEFGENAGKVAKVFYDTASEKIPTRDWSNLDKTEEEKASDDLDELAVPLFEDLA